jgi:hypothetical protein
VFGQPTNEQPTWNIPDVTALSQLMRHVISHKEERMQIATNAFHLIQKEFTWDKSVQRMADRLFHIADKSM